MLHALFSRCIWAIEQSKVEINSNQLEMMHSSKGTVYCWPAAADLINFVFHLAIDNNGNFMILFINIFKFQFLTELLWSLIRTELENHSILMINVFLYVYKSDTLNSDTHISNEIANDNDRNVFIKGYQSSFERNGNVFYLRFVH